MLSGIYEPLESKRIVRLTSFTVPMTLLAFFLTFSEDGMSVNFVNPPSLQVKGCTLIYYHLSGNSHSGENSIDRYDSFLKDENGRINIKPTGHSRYSEVSQGTYVEYEVQTQRGHSITIYQQAPNRGSADKSNCHGFVFLDGEYWVFSSQVQTILDDSRWVAVAGVDVVNGDIAVYRQANGRVCHTAIIVGRDLAGNLLVDSKNGYEPLRKSIRVSEVIAN